MGRENYKSYSVRKEPLVVFAPTITGFLFLKTDNKLIENIKIKDL